MNFENLFMLGWKITKMIYLNSHLNPNWWMQWMKLFLLKWATSPVSSISFLIHTYVSGCGPPKNQTYKTCTFFVQNFPPIKEQTEENILYCILWGEISEILSLKNRNRLKLKLTWHWALNSVERGGGIPLSLNWILFPEEALNKLIWSIFWQLWGDLFNIGAVYWQKKV